MPAIRPALAALLALVLVLPAARVRAQSPPAGASAFSLPAWWARPGEPGWTPDANLAGGMPWTFAGLTAGAWDLRDPLAPAALPAPGIPEAQPPLAWDDSASVVVGEGGGWSGFGASLAVAREFVKPPGGHKPRAVLTVVNGTSGIDRNGIFLTRGDERTWLRGGAVGDKRGSIGDLDLAGDHVWSVAAGTRRGASTLDFGFAQRGLGQQQRAGVGETGSGQSGDLGWGWTKGTDSLGARFTRGFDGRDLFAVGTDVSPVRREASQNDWEVAAGRRVGPRALTLHLTVRDARVRRRIENPLTGTTSTEWSTRSWWLASRWAAPLAGGALELELGGGMDRSAARAAERRQLAHSASWRLGPATRRLRLFTERTVVPIWSDLDPLTKPFVQDTWVAGAELTHDAGATQASLLAVAGRVGNRATILRYPIRTESLLLGWQRDDAYYDFALERGSIAGRWRALAGDASGWVGQHTVGVSQTRVDPDAGASLGGSVGFRLFAGDLGVRLRAQGAFVGSRETDTRVIPDVTLPGFATVSAAATLTLGDATMVLRGDALDGARHPESWIDPSQTNGFVLARTNGRTFRFELIWPFFN